MAGRKHLALATALFAGLTFGPASASAEPFTFVALGDMPYGEKAEVYPPFEALIGEINNRAPAFSIHVGDTKAGRGACSDQRLIEQLDYLNSFESAVVYTPGDNEWTDCHREAAGSMDPLDRLAFIRKSYFEEPGRSFGMKPMPVESQAEVMADAFAGYPENIRFEMDGVHFVVTHVVGSNNNFEARSMSAVEEFFARNDANIAWLKDSFNEAVEADATAFVLAIHANMFEFGFNEFGREGFLRHSGFKSFAEALVQDANAFGRPVLLVYGDSHIYRITRPFKKTAPNLTALEVFGAADMHAVEISVDTDTAEVFDFRPIWNPGLSQ